MFTYSGSVSLFLAMDDGRARTCVHHVLLASATLPKKLQTERSTCTTRVSRVYSVYAYQHVSTTVRCIDSGMKLAKALISATRNDERRSVVGKGKWSERYLRFIPQTARAGCLSVPKEKQARRQWESNQVRRPALERKETLYRLATETASITQRNVTAHMGGVHIPETQTFGFNARGHSVFVSPSTALSPSIGLLFQSQQYLLRAG